MCPPGCCLQKEIGWGGLWWYNINCVDALGAAVVGGTGVPRTPQKQVGPACLWGQKGAPKPWWNNVSVKNSNTAKALTNVRG